MKICIIHGSPRKGNTFKLTEIFIEELQRYGDFETTEYFLPKDMPHFCCGCFVCFEKGGDKCPHAQYIQPIAESIRKADGLIITSPVYSLAESGGVKALLDHFSYIFMNHRPMEEMFSKVAMVISTAAGYGTGHAIKTIQRTLRFWGMRRVLKCGFNLYAVKWKDVDKGKQQKICNTLRKKAEKFHTMLLKRENLQPYIFTRVYFKMCKKLISGFSDGQTDKEYWKQKGWLYNKNRPF